MNHGRIFWGIAALVLAVVSLSPALGFPLFNDPPAAMAMGQSRDAVPQGGTVLLSATIRGGPGPTQTLLATNESGEWRNTSIEGQSMVVTFSELRIVSFLWSNSSVPSGREVGWRIWLRDPSGAWSATEVRTFLVTEPDPPPSHHSAFTVCAAGCDFSSIQAAVDFAAPGDRVLVLNGTYTEGVVLNKERLQLIGESPANTTIDGNNVLISANGTTVANLSVRNTGVGIVIASNNNTISGNDISRTRDGTDVQPLFPSVLLPGKLLPDNNTLVSNFAHDNDIVGIAVRGSNHTLRDNVAIRNNVSGIAMVSGERVTLSNNTAVENALLPSMEAGGVGLVARGASS